MTDVEAVAGAAAAAAPEWAATPPEARARSLRAAADALEAHRAELIGIAADETGLGLPRLEGELTRTIVQLRLFSDVAATGEDLDVRIDDPDPGFVLGPRPDLRRYRVALGPVLNFAASNFPFAFSVAGGDTASALAAGCTVIVKAHSGHPRLSVRTAEIVSNALVASGAPSGTLALVSGQDAGLALMRDPRIKAASFTGSTGVGRMLADIAAARPAPIPFYGELGSLNPVFLTSAAIAERGDEIARGLATAVAGSAGQLCTKPGFVFVPAGHDLSDTLVDALGPMPEQRLLTTSVSRGFVEGRERALADAAVEAVLPGTVRVGDDQYAWVTPSVATVTAAELVEHPQLVEEVFGPFTFLVTYEPTDDLVTIADQIFEGNLTVTVHAGEGENVRPLLDWAADHAGRVIFGGWPTGVSVTPAQQHGGPWPATTLDTGTSVGTAAVTRFQRAVAYQDVPDAMLPEALRDSNPWNVPQRRSPAGESTGWGAE
ncbi:aldehyde dehydrogenase (NADP(+)) [soil metagenome]